MKKIMVIRILMISIVLGFGFFTNNRLVAMQESDFGLTEDLELSSETCKSILKKISNAADKLNHRDLCSTIKDIERAYLDGSIACEELIIKHLIDVLIIEALI